MTHFSPTQPCNLFCDSFRRLDNYCNPSNQPVTTNTHIAKMNFNVPKIIGIVRLVGENVCSYQERIESRYSENLKMFLNLNLIKKKKIQ